MINMRTMALVVVVAGLALMPLLAWAAVDRSRPSHHDLDSLGISTGPEQELMIADGWVTDDEFRAAISATRNCVTAEGVELTPEAEMSPSITALTAASGLHPDAVAGVVAKCMGKYLNRVSLMRAAQQPRVDPNSAGFLSSFSKCLTDGGLPPETPLKSFDDLLRFADQAGGTRSSQVLRQCQRSFPEYFALAGD